MLYNYPQNLISESQKKKPISPNSPLLSQQPLISLLYRWICWFCTFHISGIIYLAFCVVFGFFHFSQCFQGSSKLYHLLVFHSFVWLSNSSLFGYTTFCISSHSFMSIWDVATLGLLWIVLPWTFCVQVFL